MKTRPVVPARWQRNDEGLPWSTEFADSYHPAAGPFDQAAHVFIGGNGLPERWRGRDRFVVLETGFGLGNNFLATWQAWRNDPDACQRLSFISIERHPLLREDLRDAHRDSPLSDLAGQLIDRWPPLTPNLHQIDFEEGRVRLLLAFGDVSTWLPELIAEVDAFYLDGFTPARNPDMWQPRVYKAMARLAAPGATVATWTAARVVRDGLAAAGFETRLTEGIGGKRDITLARYAPAFTPRRSTPRIARSTPDERHAIIVGAGLAGCSTAWALAEQGWSSTVIDRRPGPAGEASGNPAGLFHGTLHPQDGPHARFNRAASFQVERAARIAIERHGVQGEVHGLLRLTDGESTLEAMRALLDAQSLPRDFIEALGADEAAAICGLQVDAPAWFYPTGGWISPAGLARSFLERAGSSTSFIGGVDVASISRIGGRWRLLDANGRTIDEAATVVLANSAGAPRLIAGFDGSDWPVESVRGQISITNPKPGLALPRLPIAGSGYLLPQVGNDMIFGATSQVDDDDGEIRRADHVHNLGQLGRLYGSSNAGSSTHDQSTHDQSIHERSNNAQSINKQSSSEPFGPRPSIDGFDLKADELRGRVGWRLVARDRLPIIGGVPDRALALEGKRLDQARRIPRHAGLFMFTALGSRGITWSPLGARVLASIITGAPCPVESSLLDAVDAARFIARDARVAPAMVTLSDSLPTADPGESAALGSRS